MKTRQGLRPLHEIEEIYDKLLWRLNAEPLAGAGMTERDENGYARPTSPLEEWDRAIGGVTLERVPERQLAFLLRDRKTVKVRDGKVKVEIARSIYEYVALAPEYDLTALASLDGKEVELAYDRYDLGRAIVYYRGVLRCVVESAPLVGMGAADLSKHMHAQAAERKHWRKYNEAAREVGFYPPLQRAMEDGARVMAERQEPPAKESTLLYAGAAQAARAVNGGPVQPVRMERFVPDDDGDAVFMDFGDE